MCPGGGDAGRIIITPSTSKELGVFGIVPKLRKGPYHGGESDGGWISIDEVCLRDVAGSISLLHFYFKSDADLQKL